MSSWGYVVIGSQLRGNDGGEGKEEYGGKDVNDILNLIPVLAQIPNADTSRIGMEGLSSGGMRTFLAMKKTCRIKAAAVTGAGANLFADTGRRWEEMEKEVYFQVIPDYFKNKDSALRARSAVFWADQMCKTTPLLMMQGSADWRTTPPETFGLLQKLHEYRHPTRFIFFEGADHSLSEYYAQGYDERKKHFDYYVRDRKKWPGMEPHGQ
jgi:dipeptidyl aminopeptidase/acylaminoacyl peptidase